MPSHPPDSGWNFSSVFDLIDSDPHAVGSPTLRPEPRSTRDGSEGGVQLGNFMKLYEHLGIADTPPTILPPLDESEYSTSDDALLPSPMIELPLPPLGDAQSKAHKFTSNANTVSDEETQVGLTKKQRQKARRKAEKEQEQKEEADKVQKILADLSLKFPDPIEETPTRTRSNVSAKIRPASPAPTVNTPQPPQTPNHASRLLVQSRPSLAPSATPRAPPTQLAKRVQVDVISSTPGFPVAQISQPRPRLQPPQFSTPTRPSHGLVPRTVRPVTVPRQSQSAVPSYIPPSSPTKSNTPLIGQSSLIIRSQVDRHFHLFEMLLSRFPEDKKWLVAPRQLVNEKTSSEGVHVFVDASNIMIGLKDILRRQCTRQYDISFDSLALLMERRRPNAKRVLVGSHRESNPLAQTTRLIETCKAVGYECNVQEQVFIAREETSKKKFFNDVNKHGWQKAISKRTSSGSDSETGAPAAPPTPSAPKWVEQGVDELLHLKMCQSLLDTEVPSTMVLATGDGAEAEMSDGFLAHVERALRLGWTVELITWRQQTNGGYKRKSFRQKWGEQFKIIELDDFLEDLIDTP